MPRLTLATMNVAQAAEHYHRLNQTRFDKAKALFDRAEMYSARSPERKLLSREAERTLEKAEAFARPRQWWQRQRAQELLMKYGVRVAAGSMIASGFDFETVRRTLKLPDRG